MKNTINALSLPLGRVTEIYGPLTAGKTQLALSLIEQAQHSKICLLVDADHKITANDLTAAGIEHNNVIVIASSMNEIVFYAVSYLLSLEEIGYGNCFIVIDSTASLIPQKFMDMPVSDITVKQQRRDLLEHFNKILPMLDKKGGVLVFISQEREDLNHVPYTTGGKAVSVNASVRIRIDHGITVTKNRSSNRNLLKEDNDSWFKNKKTITTWE